MNINTFVDVEDFGTIGVTVDDGDDNIDVTMATRDTDTSMVLNVREALDLIGQLTAAVAVAVQNFS